MIKIGIPGFGGLELGHVVLDYNGTLALEGELRKGVIERLAKLSEVAQIHIVTADTFGKAAAQLKDLPCKLHIMESANEDLQKQYYVESLGSENVVAFGNGNNDRGMLQAAKLGIAIIGSEGCAHSALQSADIIMTDINEGLDLLLNPMRCKATLRY